MNYLISWKSFHAGVLSSQNHEKVEVARLVSSDMDWIQVPNWATVHVLESRSPQSQMGHIGQSDYALGVQSSLDIPDQKICMGRTEKKSGIKRIPVYKSLLS